MSTVFDKKYANAILEKLATVVKECKECSIITQDMVYSIVNAEYQSKDDNDTPKTSIADNYRRIPFEENK